MTTTSLATILAIALIVGCGSDDKGLSPDQEAREAIIGIWEGGGDSELFDSEWTFCADRAFHHVSNSYVTDGSYKITGLVLTVEGTRCMKPLWRVRCDDEFRATYDNISINERLVMVDAGGNILTFDPVESLGFGRDFYCGSSRRI